MFFVLGLKQRHVLSLQQTRNSVLCTPSPRSSPPTPTRIVPLRGREPATLQVNLQGAVYAKAGAMIAMRGDIKFSRKGTLTDGVGKFLKKTVTGEGMTLMKMEGNGRVWLADRNKRVHVLGPEGESLCVNGNDLLALQSTLTGTS